MKQGKVELKGWKACKVEMVSQEVEAKAKGARGLVTRAYSLTCLKVKLCPNRRGGGVGVRGEVKEEFERNMDTKGPWSTIATQVFALEEDVVLEVPPNF